MLEHCVSSLEGFLNLKQACRVGCGWQFDWIRLDFCQTKVLYATSCKILQSAQTSMYTHWSYQFRLQSPRLVRYPVVANHSKPSNNQMRCPCSIHFFLPLTPWFTSPKKNASLVVMLFFPNLLARHQPISNIPLKKYGASKSLELFTYCFKRSNGGTLKPKIL